MDNQQLCNLTNEEIQLLLSLYFGDGHFIKQNINSGYSVYTSCIHKDYLEYKKSLLSNLSAGEVKLFNNPGYKKNGKIYKFTIHTNSKISDIYKLSFEEKLNMLDELGLALWFYDDGSLHKDTLFYNLCTHAFTFEQQELIITKLESYGLKPKILQEVKKDGRIFYYIYIRKYNGADFISKIMSKVNIESMKYKLWSSETIQKWSTFQEEWKNLESLNKPTFKQFAIHKTRSDAGLNRYKKIKI